MIRRKSVLAFWKAVYRLGESDFHRLHADDPAYLEGMVDNLKPTERRTLRLWLRMRERRERCLATWALDHRSQAISRSHSAWVRH